MHSMQVMQVVRKTSVYVSRLSSYSQNDIFWNFSDTLMSTHEIPQKFLTYDRLFFKKQRASYWRLSNIISLSRRKVSKIVNYSDLSFCWRT